MAGWARSRLRIPGGLVLDVGSGAYPNPSADVLCDSQIDDDMHRHGHPLVIDGRPLVVALAESLPFRAHSFELVIASHIAEHVADPGGFCAELARVARSGYVETPSPLADHLLHEEYHLWRVSASGGVLRFRRKGPRSRWVGAAADLFYKTFYAGRADCARPIWRLPAGMPGRFLSRLLWLVGGVLNRTGVMHTRYKFDSAKPMRWSVEA